MSQIFWDTISQSSFKLCPDKFIGIKFRGIAGETINMETMMPVQKISHRRRPMNRTTVPQKNHVSFNMLKQMAHKRDNFSFAYIPIAIEADIEPKTPSFRRYTNPRHGRDFSPTTCRWKNGGFASRRPAMDDGRDKKKAAFIHENQMGSKLFCLFLYAAKRFVSNTGCPVLVSLWPFWSVSDSSSPSHPSDTKGSRCSSEHRNACVSKRRFVSVSRLRLDNLLPVDLVPKHEEAFVSDACLTGMGGPASVSAAARPSRSFDRLDASARQNLKKRASTAATARKDWPSLRSAMAQSLRFSSTFGLPWGLIPHSIAYSKKGIHYLVNSQ